MATIVQIEPTPAEIAAAGAAGALSLLLADRLYDIGEDALDKEYDIRDRTHEIIAKYVDEWRLKEFPQKDYVSDVIYNLTAPVTDYNDVLSTISSLSEDIGQASVRGISTLTIKGRVDCLNRNCRTESEMMVPVLIGQSANYIYRHQERRRYEIDDHYRKLASMTDRGLEVNPDQAVSLMTNASSLYGTVGTAAMQAASGAANAAGTFFGYMGYGLSGGYV